MRELFVEVSAFPRFLPFIRCERHAKRMPSLIHGHGQPQSGRDRNHIQKKKTESDLFGERPYLCGGVSALVKMAFERSSTPDISRKSHTSNVCTS